MRLSTIVSVLAASTLCAAAPTAEGSSYVLHEKRHAEPHQWTKRARAHSAMTLPVKIGLTQRNLHRAEEFVMDIAHPASPNFGMSMNMFECPSYTLLTMVKASTGQLRRLPTHLLLQSTLPIKSSHGYSISASVQTD